MQINIHVGAHKTATTLIQDHLHLHRQAISESNTLWNSYQTIRPILTNKLSKFSNKYYNYKLPLKNSSNQEEDNLHSLLYPSQNFNLVTFSDENLIGGCRFVIKNEELYPQLTSRLQIFSQILPKPPSLIFLSIRNIKSFLVSAYCESLVHADKFYPFEKYIENTDLSKLSWVSVVERIHRVFPQSKVVVWRYEDLSKVLPQLIPLLIGSNAASKIPPVSLDNKNRPSFSKKSIHLLERVSPPLTGVDYRKSAQAFKKLFPKSNLNPELKPTLLNKYKFDEMYARDANIICQMSCVKNLVY
jgi:hypothetical protein